MKGISTIVSTVMVLAVAISMVGIFSGWMPQVLGDVQDTTASQTQNQTSCNQAKIEVVSAKYWSGDSKTSITVRNNSNVDVGQVRVSAWKDGVPMDDNTSLLGGLKTLNVSTSSEPARVEASSLSCTDATSELTEIQ